MKRDRNLSAIKQGIMGALEFMDGLGFMGGADLFFLGMILIRNFTFFASN